MTQHITRFISNVLSPLLMPSYGIFLALWVSVLCYQPLGSRMAVLFVIFGITCVLPIIFIALLHNFKLIKNRRLTSRRERWLPYIATILCYAAASFYLKHTHAPNWLLAFMWGGTATCFVSFVVNFWWKISAHTAGIGGIIAMLFCIHVDGYEAFNIFWLICMTIIIAGAVGSSRLYLERHTFWQIIAGYINGYTCVYTLIRLLT